MRACSWVRILLLCSTECIQTSGRFAAAVHSYMSERIANVSVVFQEGENSALQVKPKITVDILMGKTAELQCMNKTSEGSVNWWQTPFGSFEDGKISNKDPVETVNGNLRILRTTASHNGLYYCHLVDSNGITIIPYVVNVVTANEIHHKAKMYNTRQRMVREVENSFSQTHFIAAVTSSVLVTFIGAFVLGALSRPYVIKYLPKTFSHEHKNGDNMFALAPNEQCLQFECVSFHKSTNFEDDTVAFAPKSSPRVDGYNSSLSATEGNTSDTVTRRAGDESDLLEGHGVEEQAAEAPSDSGTHRQAKRKSRVIKLYNYDEEGKRYSHIKEPEEGDASEPRGKHRVMSLTRLSALMNQAESLDFSITGDTTDSDAAKPDKRLNNI